MHTTKKVGFFSFSIHMIKLIFSFSYTNVHVFDLIPTSNGTSVTEVRSASTRLFTSMWHPRVSVITTVYYVAIIFHHRVWYRALSLCYACIQFGHHPHPLGYLCARFCFCRRLHCWASPWRIIAYSLNHSLNNSLSLFDAPVTKACTSEMTRNSVSVFETYTKLQWKFPRRQRARVAENSCSKKHTSLPRQQQCIDCECIIMSSSGSKAVAAIVYWWPLQEISDDLKTLNKVWMQAHSHIYKPSTWPGLLENTI